ncbi:MAG: SusC/RagA family TonB-linked outer membrane protein [Bacteroidales bacterium]
MKLTIIISFIAVFQVSATVYSQFGKMSFSYKDVSVKEVLNDIERTTDLRFFYNENFLDLNRKVSLEGTDIAIDVLLKTILMSSDASFRLLENNLIVIAPNEIIQQRTVTGRVTDSKTGNALPSVNVVVKNTTVGTMTDQNGKFSINLPERTAVLVFTFVGYKTRELQVNENNTYDVTLEEEAQLLEEVVVIGYGTRQKKDVTTAISSIGTRDLESIKAATPELAMQGKMAGVQVISGGNTPTSRPTIRIRGLNTWQTADPMYIIDGIPVTEFGSGAERRDPRVNDLRSPVNIMSLINPDDIESISVLKDASAAAIYGVRAANGVILITTKRGKEGAPVVEYNMNFGVQNLMKRYDVLNTREMIDFYRGSYAEAKKYKPTVTLPDLIDPKSPDRLKDSVTTYDWQTPYINKNANVTSHQLRVSGGTDKINYYISGGYDFQESTYVQDNLERYSVVTNLSAKVSRWINTGANLRLSYARSLDNNNWNGGKRSLIDVARAPAWQPIYDPDGATYLNGYAPAMLIEFGGMQEGIPPKLWDFSATKLWGPQTVSNGFGIMSTQHITYKLLRNMGNMFVEITPLKGLSIKGTVSADWYTNMRCSFGSIYEMYFNITPADPTAYSFPKDSTINTQGSYGERQVRNTNIVYNATVRYARSFGNHNLDVVFDYMNQSYRVDFTDASTSWVRSIKPEFWLVSGPRGYVEGFTGWEKGALNGYMGRFSYDYNRKYYVTFTLRRDGTSKFAPEKRWGIFPAFSGAWRISSENFMSSLTFINDLKIRYGWGQLGNQETQAFPYISKVNNAAKYALGTSSNGLGVLFYGFSFPDFPNRDLIWEKTTSQNLALDGTFFKNLSFTLEYYHKITDGILQETRLPGSVGSWNPPVVNVGKVKNSGAEISVNYRGSFGQIEYMIGGNITTNKNEVLKLFGGSPLGGQYDRIEEGMPIIYLWGYLMGGILRSQAEVDDYKNRVTNDGERSDIQQGDIWFIDQNADSTLNQDDYIYLGKTLPGFFYGFNLSLMYKGVDFGLTFTGVGDVFAYNGVRAGLEYTGSQLINLSREVLRSWTPANPNTDMPRAVYEDPAANGRMSSRFVESAAYMRLSNIELGYTVPSKLLKTLGFMNSLRVYAAGNNVLLFTKWKGLDPENEYFPIPRVMRVGLKAAF